MARYLGEFAQGRADQHCRRMLRQHSGAYCGDCEGAGGLPPRKIGDAFHAEDPSRSELRAQPRLAG